MHHKIHKIISFQILGPYRLLVTFADGLEQDIDFLPVLHGSLYGPLKELHLFNSVKIDPEVHTLVWPNGADFDPATLHDWPTEGPILCKQAEVWSAKQHI